MCRVCQIEKTEASFQTHRATCKSCRKVQQTLWRKENQEHVNLKSKQWDQKNLEKSRQIKSHWREHNKEKVLLYSQQYRQTHKSQINARTSSRRKRVQQNTPFWADKTKIVDFYKNCPMGHHVDHIIPLRGKYVSGLHVHYNLQYLPANENMKKGNSFDRN
jgi:hypothetical protein